MNYLLKNSRRGSGVWKKARVIIAILVALGFFYLFLPKFANQSIFNLARPIWNAEQYFLEKFSALSALFLDKAGLLAENEKLKMELENANTALLDRGAIKAENAELKNFFGRGETDKRTLARVLAKPNASVYDTLLLDVGENKGVKVGDKILVNNFIVGDIREVYGNYSKAMLLSTAGEKIMVTIGNTHIETEAEGRGGGNFIAKLLKEITVQKGDLVSLPSQSMKFFGVVGDVELTETSSFQFVSFSLPVNIYTLLWVEIATVENR